MLWIVVYGWEEEPQGEEGVYVRTRTGARRPLDMRERGGGRTGVLGKEEEEEEEGRVVGGGVLWWRMSLMVRRTVGCWRGDVGAEVDMVGGLLVQICEWRFKNHICLEWQR